MDGKTNKNIVICLVCLFKWIIYHTQAHKAQKRPILIERKVYMKVIFLIGKGQAYTYAEKIAKEFKKSIRFDIGNNETITIKKKDIISIETDILYPDTEKELCYKTDYKPLPDVHKLDNDCIVSLYSNIKQAMHNAAIYHSELLEMALHDDIQAIENEMKERGIIPC